MSSGTPARTRRGGAERYGEGSADRPQAPLSEPNGLQAVDESKARLADRRRATTHGRTRSLRVIAAFLGIGWPLAGVAQMVAPTPQPPGVPVTPEQVAEVEIENWAVHGQSTFTWMLQPAFHAPYTLSLIHI